MAEAVVHGASELLGHPEAIKLLLVWSELVILSRTVPKFLAG